MPRTTRKLSCEWHKWVDAGYIASLLNDKRTQSKKKVTYQGFDALVDPKSMIASALKTPEGIGQFVHYEAVGRAIFSPTQNGRIVLGDFETAYIREITEYLRKPPLIFLVVSELSYKGTAPFQWTMANDCRIQLGLSRTGRLGKILAAERATHHGRVEELVETTQKHAYQICTARVTAKSVEEAFETANDAMNEVRGLLNLYNNFGKHSRMSFGQRQPVNGIRFGKLHTVHGIDGKQAAEKFWYEHDFVEQTFLIDLNKRAQKRREWLSHVQRRTEASPISNAFFEALLRYNKALDYPDLSASFIELWSVLEFVTNTTKSSYDVTLKRAASFHADYRRALALGQHLRFCRNRLIHSQYDEKDAETLVFQTMRLIHPLLVHLMNNPFKFESLQEFSSFLDHPRDVKILKRRLHLANAALRFHSTDL